MHAVLGVRHAFLGGTNDVAKIEQSVSGSDSLRTSGHSFPSAGWLQTLLYEVLAAEILSHIAHTTDAASQELATERDIGRTVPQESTEL